MLFAKEGGRGLQWYQSEELIQKNLLIVLVGDRWEQLHWEGNEEVWY